MGSLVTVLASAFVLVAPADWTSSPSDPPLADVVVYWWAETPAGAYIPEIPTTPGYVAAGAHLVLDTSGVPTNQTICIRGWASASSFYATIEPLCAPNGDGLAPAWVVPP
jgi:hypothetical protein